MTKRNPEYGSRGSKWRYYSYDVWGNAKEGYEVNDVFRTNDIVIFPTVVLRSDKAIITYLKRIGWLKSSARRNLIELDGDEHTIYINYKGKPDGEFRRD